MARVNRYPMVPRVAYEGDLVKKIGHSIIRSVGVIWWHLLTVPTVSGW